jgi:SAM-dependent methyltransferase
MPMEDYSLLIDLHKLAKRQGPGADSDTKRAAELARLSPSEPIELLDIGCGTGASSLVLAQLLNAQITAVDFLPDFIEELRARAESLGLAEKITPLVCTMESLPFASEAYDVIWAEGAIYNIGFKSGVNYWKQFLKPGGLLVVSEITWITGSRPGEVQQYWDSQYPEISTASEKIGVLESSGYSPLAYFTLPQSSWLDNYYRPLQNSFPDFLHRHEGSEEARAIVVAEEKEIALYERYKAYYSYGMYIANKSS